MLVGRWSTTALSVHIQDTALRNVPYAGGIGRVSTTSLHLVSIHIQNTALWNVTGHRACWWGRWNVLYRLGRAGGAFEDH